MITSRDNRIRKNRAVPGALGLSAMVLVVSLVAAPVSAQIVINEIMYNSVEQIDPDVEYVEIYNSGVATQDLTGWYLLDDNDLHTKCFLDGSLAPGEYLVIAEDLAGFAGKYPTVANVNANAFAPGFGLGNGGDTVRIFSTAGFLMDTVSYDDASPWPTQPDGGGPSLELLNPGLDNSIAGNWSGSGVVDGTPGAMNSVFNLPIIEDTSRDNPLPGNADTVTVTSKVTDAQGLAGVELWVDTGSGFLAQVMFDDGAHSDAAVGDSIYGAQIAPEPSGTVVRYYVRATDTTANTATDPSNAPASYYAYTVDRVLPTLRINEVAASNTATIQDPADGKFEDWVEIENTGPDPVNIGGMFVSNNLAQSTEFELPSLVLPPGGFALIWCDNETGQGALHASFKLAKEGGEVGLFDTVDGGNVRIGGYTYGLQSPDVSFGFVVAEPGAPEYLSSPTPGASNQSSAVFSSVCINEFQTTSAAGGIDDWVELHNRGASAVDIGGWHVTDDVTQPAKYTFPFGTSIPAGGFLSVDELELGFSFSSTGSEVIMLTHANGLTGQDYFDYGPQSPDISQGRLPNGTANWEFLHTTTEANSNTCLGTPAVALPPVELSLSGASGLVWDAVIGATHYDVVTGDLAALILNSGATGNYAAAGMSCLENDSPDPVASDISTPAVGQVIFYLARPLANCVGTSYSSEGPGEVAGRDATIPSWPFTCP